MANPQVTSINNFNEDYLQAVKDLKSQQSKRVSNIEVQFSQFEEKKSQMKELPPPREYLEMIQKQQEELGISSKIDSLSVKAKSSFIEDPTRASAKIGPEALMQLFQNQMKTRVLQNSKKHGRII